MARTRVINIRSAAYTQAGEEALRAIEEALTDITGHRELDTVGALLNRRWSQINAQADYRSIAENGFEPGDPVLVGGDPKIYKVVRVGIRSLVLTDGTTYGKATKKGPGEIELVTHSYQARHVRLSDRLFKEARKAHVKLGG